MAHAGRILDVEDLVGLRAMHDAVLEDEATLASGLLALYEATFDERWFVAARERADAMLARFSDPDGGFFDTAEDAEALVVRPRSLQDGATPSGNATAAAVLLRLAAWMPVRSYRWRWVTVPLSLVLCCVGAVSLYMEMAPHSANRANGRAAFKAASRWSPPTLSK